MSSASGLYPDWVPKSVSLLAAGTPLQNEISQRLLTDTRMKDVWPWLMQDANPQQDRRRIHMADNALRLSTWGIEDHGILDRDQLCGAFFVQALQEMSIRAFTSTKAKLEAAAQPWASAAEHCRMATKNLPFGADLLSHRPELRQALKTAAEHLQWIADAIEQKDNPRVLSRSSGGDDLVRSHARVLVVAAQHLFGRNLHGIVAKVVSVGLALDEQISPKQVENWTQDLTQISEPVRGYP